MALGYLIGVNAHAALLARQLGKLLGAVVDYLAYRAYRFVCLFLGEALELLLSHSCLCYEFIYHVYCLFVHCYVLHHIAFSKLRAACISTGFSLYLQVDSALSRYS